MPLNMLLGCRGFCSSAAENEKMEKLIFELLEKSIIKKLVIEFLILDVSTSDVCQHMTTF